MTDQELIDLYQAGYSTRQLEKPVGRNARWINRRLVALGVQMRPPLGPRKATLPGIEPVPNNDAGFLAAIFAAHPLGYLGPWYDKKRAA